MDTIRVVTGVTIMFTAIAILGTMTMTVIVIESGRKKLNLGAPYTSA